VVLLAPTLSREGAIVAGVLATVPMYALAYFAVFGRSPGAFGGRPWRYSIPNAAGLLAAIAVYQVVSDAAMTFALAVPLLVAGQSASQFWWASAAAEQPTRAPA
jgi:hypothetical protein